MLILRDAVGGFGLAEEVFAGLFCYETGVFELEIGTLNLPFVDGKSLRQHRRRRERLAGSDCLAVDVIFNLLAHLSVDRALRQILQCNIHGRVLV